MEVLDHLGKLEEIETALTGKQDRKEFESSKEYAQALREVVAVVRNAEAQGVPNLTEIVERAGDMLDSAVDWGYGEGDFDFLASYAHGEGDAPLIEDPLHGFGT